MIRRLLQFRVQARQPGIVERKPARSDQAEKRKRDSGRNSSGFRPQQPCPTHAHFRSPCLNSVYLDPPEPMLEIGRAPVCTPVTNAHLVCRLLLETKKKYNKQ